MSERGAQLTRQAVNYIVRMAGERAKLGRVWPHMLRHSCGYYLVDQAPICAPYRTTSVTEIPSTPRTTPVLPGIGSRDNGDRLTGFPLGRLQRDQTTDTVAEAQTAPPDTIGNVAVLAYLLLAID